MEEMNDFEMEETNNKNNNKGRRRVDDPNHKSIEMIPLTSDGNGENNHNNNILDSGIDFEALAIEHYNRLKASPSQANEIYDNDDVKDDGNDDRLAYPWLSKKWNDWLFPPNVPRPCQLFRKENVAVPACYLVVGLLQGISGPLLNVYPLALNATEAQQTTIASLRSLPASFKLLFGFLSDNVLLFGYRRKSYMFVGWLMSAISMACLLLTSQCSKTTEDGQTQPSITGFSLSVLLFGTGFWFADVMADSIVAEKAKFEPEHARGQLQSTCYACRFFGLMVAAPVSSYVYSTLGPRPVIFAMSTLPLAILPFVYCFYETQNQRIKPTSEQCLEIWKTVCSRAVWQPMGFVYLYNLLQVSNSAWKEFLKSGLGFSDNQLNVLLIVAYVLLYAGILAYKYYFIRWSWRSVYIMTTLIGGVFSLLQIFLITGHTFGLDPFWFALGDDVFVDFVSGIQFLPTTIMMVHLCPVGSEGASYAMFTTVNNSAGHLSSAISTQLLGIWDVSKAAIVAGDWDGMFWLTLMTTLVQMSGVLFVKLLPRTKEDLEMLHQDSFSGSHLGGGVFLFLTIASILYVMVVGFLNIVNPGWAGES